MERRESTSDYRNLVKVNWSHRDPLNTMARAGNASGRDLYSIDPLGVQAKAASQSDIDGYFGGSPDMNNPPEGFYQDSGGNTGSWGSSAPNPGNWGLGCYIDGIQTSCERAFRTINNGGAQSATLSLNGAVGSAAAPIVAGFAAAATSINGQSTTRTRVVPRVVPGEPVVTITSESGEVLDTLFGPDRVAGYDRVEEVGAISGDLAFGGLGQGSARIPQIDPLGGISEGDYGRVYNLLNKFVNDGNCLNAFKDNIGTDLASTLTSSGNYVRIGGFSALQGDILTVDQFTMNKMGLNTDGANYVRRGLGIAVREANAWTIADKKYLVEGSRPSILLNKSALDQGDLHLAYTLLHELAHAAGWKSNGKRGGWLRGDKSFYPGVSGHDLDHVPGYDEILSTCAKGIK